MMFVARSEPAPLKALGTTDGPDPEEYGVDFLFFTKRGLVGVQRKEIKDLVASIRGDDRLYRELDLMKTLSAAFLIVEGDWHWDRQGMSQTVPGILRAQYRGIVRSVQAQRVIVETSDDIPDTAAVLSQIQSWVARDAHNSLFVRPKSRAFLNTWKDEDLGAYWWQTFPGVSIALAKKLYDALGVPVEWTVDEAELRKVQLIGKVRASRIYQALPGRNGHA